MAVARHSQFYQNRPPPQPWPQQPGLPTMPSIINFQHVNRSTKDSVEIFITDNNCVDRESVRRRFGWSTLGMDCYIPFIIRDNEKYCATRMVDKFILETFLTQVTEIVYLNCTNIPSFFVTLAEVHLLNEINEFHCDYYYGHVPFKPGDILVRTADAIEFYDYLVFCYNKLFNRSSPSNDRCGFLAINQTSMVPFVVCKEQKYLPLFYFEEVEHINFNVHKVTGWDLAYLKFCFKIQGIREEFCRHDVLEVLAIEEVKEYFEPNATFREIWPSSSTERQSLVRTGSKIGVKAWYRPPTQTTKSISKQMPAAKGAAIQDPRNNMYYTNL